MTRWHYVDGARNRVGPLTADELREHYRQRRLSRDSLVWCDGMVQWVALERVAVELDIDSITPVAAMPPPLPARVTAHASRPPTRSQQKGMSGCLIALIVCGAAAVPLAGILAAIAIPAYRDYVERARHASAAAPAYDKDAMAQSDAQVRTLVARAMTTYYPQRRECPDTFEFESLQVRDPGLAGNYTVDLDSNAGQHCGYRVTFLHQGPMIEGKALRYDAIPSGESVEVRCSTTDIAAEFRPPNCG
ncbi:hypothetical protein GCM10027431_21680 [Lysobacter rhizosphaerae]